MHPHLQLEVRFLDCMFTESTIKKRYASTACTIGNPTCLTTNRVDRTGGGKCNGLKDGVEVQHKCMHNERQLIWNVN